MSSVTLDTDVTLGFMAACNIRNIDQSLMREMKVRAAQEGLTLRDWVIRALTEAAYGKASVVRQGRPGRKSKEPESVPGDVGEGDPGLSRPAHSAGCICYLCKPPK